MSTTWSALRAQLVRSVNRHSALETFAVLFSGENQRPVFRDPTHLLDWLHARQGSSEEKNVVLLQLLEGAGQTGQAGDLAVGLLLLALWPGLCVIRNRVRPLSPSGLLDADLLAGLTTGIRNADPSRVRRVAATLLRNLERDLRQDYRQDDRWNQMTVDMDLVAGKVVQPETERPEAILSSARAALGDDGVLLTAIYICGFSQKQAGELIGLSHEAARKRCQRSLALLKKKHL